MSEELKLKPCPLCGGKADFWGGAGAVLAGCSKCNIHTIYCYPPEDAKIARIAELEREIKFLKTEMTCWDSYIKELEKKESGNE